MQIQSLGLFNGRQHDSVITLPVAFALNSVESDDYTVYGLVKSQGMFLKLHWLLYGCKYGEFDLVCI